MTANSQLPTWFAWVQLLTPAFIALIALIITAWIQIGQKTISRNKLKLDLFKDRYELLNIVNNMIQASHKDSDEFFFQMSKEYEKFRQYGLLFPKPIADKVDRLWDLCHDYRVLREERDELHGSPPRWSEANRKWRESQKQVDSLAKELRSEIAEFIRVEWKG